MGKKQQLKASAFFCLFTGIFNIITWIFIISSGNVTDFNEELMSYLFHWMAELTTAILLILAGIKILIFSRPDMNLFFLSLGLLLMAIGSAFIHYLINFEPLIFTVSIVITGITIIILITSYRSTSDFIFITLGISIYALLNILGKVIQEKEIALTSIALASLIFIVILTINISNKEIVLKFQKK